jgi:hypothetical protein
MLLHLIIFYSAIRGSLRGCSGPVCFIDYQKKSCFPRLRDVPLEAHLWLSVTNNSKFNYKRWICLFPALAGCSGSNSEFGSACPSIPREREGMLLQVH